MYNYCVFKYLGSWNLDLDLDLHLDLGSEGAPKEQNMKISASNFIIILENTKIRSSEEKLDLQLDIGIFIFSPLATPQTLSLPPK